MKLPDGPYPGGGRAVKNLKRTAAWIASTIGSWALLYFAMHGVVWCWNLFRFLAWLFTATYVLGYFMARDMKSPEKGPRPVPSWMAALSDFSMAGLLAAYGHFAYVALMVVQQLFESAFWQEIKEQSAKEQKA